MMATNAAIRAVSPRNTDSTLSRAPAFAARPYRGRMADPVNPYVLPPGLPAPMDDGAADHLEGMAIPPVALPSTSGDQVDLSEAAGGTLVLYLYPRTGRPGEPLPERWAPPPSPCLRAPAAGGSHYPRAGTTFRARGAVPHSRVRSGITSQSFAP